MSDEGTMRCADPNPEDNTSDKSKFPSRSQSSRTESEDENNAFVMETNLKKGNTSSKRGKVGDQCGSVPGQRKDTCSSLHNNDLIHKMGLNPNTIMRSFSLPTLWRTDSIFAPVKLLKARSEPIVNFNEDFNLGRSMDEAKSEPANLQAEMILSTKNGFTTRSEPETRVKSGKIRHSVYFRREMSTVVLAAMKNKQILFDENDTNSISRQFETFGPSIKATKNDSVTVKFVIGGTQQIFTKAFNIYSTISMLRENLAMLLGVNSQEILLSHLGNPLGEMTSLLDAGAVPFKTMQLAITLPELTDASLLSVKTNYVPMVDIITVRFTDEFGREVERTVEIENQSLSKPWLGGFKHIRTKKCYHHAQTQTKCLLRLKLEYSEQTGTSLPQLISRQVQTPIFPLKNKSVSTVTSAGIQTYQDSIVIINPYDKVLKPKKYETYEEWFNKNNVLQKVVKIQRYVRRRKVIQKIERLLGVYKILDLAEKKSTQETKLTEDNAEERESSESPYGKKHYNFPIIVSMINEWWKKEKERIAASKTEAPRKAEMYQLLKKEINLLTALQKKQSEVQKESTNMTDVLILDRVAEPIKFRSRTGETIFIDGLETQKAREFIQVYKNLVQKCLSVRGRIEVLLKAKSVAANSDGYKFSAQLQRLIERELSLLRIGVGFSDISELQRRIHQLFLDYIKRPEFNPAIVSKGFDQLSSNILFTCTRCLRSLPLFEFSADSRKKKLDICNACLKIENVATTRIDFTPYERMLKLIRDDEIRRRCYSSTCFILQPYGIYFIVNVIWYGESALSEADYLPDLRLVRWEVRKVWSPWNCILLTKEEAPVHLKIANIHEVYNPNFIQKIRLKHYTTKSNFKMLLKSDMKIDNNNLWQSVKDDGELINSKEMNRYIEKSESIDATVANFESMIQSLSSREE